jgi:hypothetical protein
MAIRYILWQFGIFYGHFVYFMTIWYIFGIYFFPVWYIAARKIWQPCLEAQSMGIIIVA